MENQKKNVKKRTYNSNKKRRVKKENVWRIDMPKFDNSNVDLLKYSNYYKLQKIVPDEEWDLFVSSLRTDLPSTWRVTATTDPEKNMIIHMLKTAFNQPDNNIENKKVVDEKNDTNNTIDNNNTSNNSTDNNNIATEYEGPKQVNWYPEEDLAWRIKSNKKELKKNQKLRQYIVNQTELGNITRQEEVSMIPPLLLDVQSHHVVLDMCAAPGSKTIQLIEAIHKNCEEPEGFVVANDANFKRSYLLAHHSRRSASPNIIITNHDAVFFPSLRLENGEVIKFDRVLCDVPCSSDATARKNPSVWTTFDPNLGMGLHKLQLSLGWKGAQLLKVGGRMVYSTCSFNPIENEAVVAHLIRLSKGSLRLVDSSDKLPKLKRNGGLETWKIVNMTKKQWTNEYSSEPILIDKYEDVEKAQQEKYTFSMFPPTKQEYEEFHLERTLRLLPHHQDTGGFFVAILEKVKDLPVISGPLYLDHSLDDQVNVNKDNMDTKKDEEVPKETIVTEEVKKDDNKKKNNNNNNNNENKNNSRAYSEKPFIKYENEYSKRIEEYFGITKKDFWEHCMVRTEELTNIYFVAKGIQPLLPLSKTFLNIINTGTRVLCREKKRKEGEVLEYRLCSESAKLFLPFISKYFFEIDMEEFKLLLSEESSLFGGFNEKLREGVKNIVWGPFMGVLKTSFGNIAFPLNKNPSSLALYLSKQEKKIYTELIAQNLFY